MKKIILALLLIISTTGNAKFRQIVNIKYQTDYGWSKYYNVEVTFMMGYELNSYRYKIKLHNLWIRGNSTLYLWLLSNGRNRSGRRQLVFLFKQILLLKILKIN
jgi:hypothetical protein